MRVTQKALLTINRATLADSTRAIKGRVPGAFQSIRNLISQVSDGIGRIRRGYQAYTSGNNGLTPPTGMQVTKILGIESPSSEDVHLYFSDSGGQTVKINPWWRGATKVATDLQINESKSFTGVTGSFPAANQMQITGSDALGLSATADYYRYWVMKNSTQTEFAQVTAYTYSAAAAGTSTFTFVEDVDATGLIWVVTNAFVLYRHFHENTTFAPAYNSPSGATGMANPPIANAENSIIRFSGGQGSTNGNRGIWLRPKLDRIFFPAHARTFTYSGTYASERELKSLGKTDLVFGNAGGSPPSTDGKLGGLNLTGALGLTHTKTYWVGIAAIYDGFQVGQLRKFETASDYSMDNSAWASFQNYLQSTSDGEDRIDLQFALNLGTLNKRITGFAIYLSQDAGDTRTSGRQSPYYYVGTVSLVTTDAYTWTFDGVTGTFRTNFYIDGLKWNNKGNIWLDDSGYLETPTDIMYAYSTEEILGSRRLLANAYVTSESLVDRSNIFTNPIGGNPAFNLGVIQPDVFSNEEPTYRMRVDPTVGTRINSLVPLGIEDCLVLKERGIIECRVLNIDGLPALQQNFKSKDVGCSTVNAWAKDDDGMVYFPAYQDIYRYKNGLLDPVIERADKNDWLETYRNTLTAANKENACIFYWPEEKILFFFFGNENTTAYNSLQYIYHPISDQWREIRLKEVTNSATHSFKFASFLKNGHVVLTTAESTPTNKKLGYFWTGSAFTRYYVDDGTSIIPYFDTGDLYIGGEDLDKILTKVVVNRSFSDVINDLDAKLYRDGTAITFTDLEGTSSLPRLGIKLKPTHKRIGARWRLEYNTNTSSPEVIENPSEVSYYQIDSIEFHGRTRPRILRVTE